MKKAVSLVASFALAFSLFGAPVLSFADEGDDAASGQEVVETESLDDVEASRDDALIEYLNELDKTEFTATLAAVDTGSVEVKLTTLLVDPALAGLLVDPSNTNALRATLTGPSTKTVGFVAKSDNGLGENGFTAKADGLIPGSYTLTVEAPGFIPYTQSGVQVQAGDRASIKLVDRYSNMVCKGKEHMDETTHELVEEVPVEVCGGQGLMPYGNLNGKDGIDNADAKLLLQSIVRVRTDPELNGEEYAKFGMNLVKDVLASEETGNVKGTRPVDTPDENVEVIGSEESAEVPSIDDQLSNASAFDTYSRVELAANGSEEANVETPGRPQFRLANATEDEGVETHSDTAQDENAAVEDAAAGTVGRVKHTEPLKVGLNAFQRLAAMRNAQTFAASVIAKSETDHMQVAPSADTDIVLDTDKSLNEVLFNDNGDMVKMYPADDATISETNPVQLTVNAGGDKMRAVTISVPHDSPNAPTAGQIIVQDTANQLTTYGFVTEGTGGHVASVVNLHANSFGAGQTARMAYAADESAAPAQSIVDPASGTITVNFANQVAVKTITIRVTDTSSKKLAEIAQVEFLNDFQKLIPKPDLDIPTPNQPTVASKSITLSWNAQRNVTGYEVEISYNGAASVISTVKNNVTVKNIAGKELTNYRTYTLRVRSTNGDWRSPWSAAVEATPQASGAPKVPGVPKVSGGYDFITVSWKAAEDAETHNVQYRKRGDNDWITVQTETTALKCTIPAASSADRLLLRTEYQVRVQGVNHTGKNGAAVGGPWSAPGSATTTPEHVKVPWYKLLNKEVINKEQGITGFESVIEKVEGDNGNTASNDPRSMVDGDYSTYYTGMKGGYHHGGTVTFKGTYDLDTIVLTGYQGQSLNIYDLIVQAWDADNKPIKPSGGNIKKSVMTYSSKTQTVMIRTEKLAGVKKIRVAYQRAVGNAWSASTIAELAFYNSTLYSDVMALWADDEHTVLRDGVTQSTIEGLMDEVNSSDPDTVTAQNPNGEYHPSKSVLLAELENALVVCKAGNLRAPIKVDGNLNTVGAKKGVGGLNGWQPLGVAVEAGDEISVYVGRKNVTSGDVPLGIYVVQNNPDISNGFAKRLDSSTNKVQVGLNSYVIPENISSLAAERGGSLYVEYGTGRGNNEQYTVRVAGGSAIPLLDIHNVTNADERMNRIRAYVSSVKDYDPRAQHAAKQHDTHANSSAYNPQSCIANATDIVLKDMMYSIPVSQVAGALGVTASSSADQLEAATQKLSTTLSAMDDMMTLFYQHKGFVKDNSANAKYGSNNAWPTLHQNIRCVQTSGSVFMYAAGNHIGIQFDSTSGLISSPGVTLGADGAYQSGKFFGWGISHEIGHEINNGAYTYAEVTNNYYAQLAQATDNPQAPKLRWGNYDTIYNRVSSGGKGMSMGKTGIAMYWQLHLAYDNDYNYTTYAKGIDQLDNLVFARMDAYGRNVSMAPKAATNGHALTLEKANKDNVIMRLACAATQKNLLDFFQAWGLTPDAETIAYATQWPVEERAIQYQTDALRLYRLGDFTQGSIFGLTSKQAEGAAARAHVTAGLSYPGYPEKKTESQTITVTLNNATVSSDILGYEVLRNGSVIGFLRANNFDNCEGKFTASGSAEFVDTINTVNNRVFEYQVRAVDKLLARGELVTAGEVKVSHKNSLDKTKWTATTNMASGSAAPNETHTKTVTVADETVGSATYDIEDNATEEETTERHPVADIIDNKTATVFSGALPANSSDSSARITINFNEPLSVVGFRVKGAAAGTAYTVETSSDGVKWNPIPTGTFEGDDAIYFTRQADEYLYGHEATYLRLTMPGQASFAASEIDVLGPQGDDAEFLTNGIGILSEDEVLGTNATNETRSIPKGSLVFLGTYKGNPAFNAILLYDQNGKILGGVADDGAVHAEEVIFAPKVEEGSKLGDVKGGFWAYYIKPNFLTPEWIASLKSVKAELYRVDNATTLEGQRLVADTLSVTMPQDLSKIDLTFGEGNQPTPEEDVNPGITEEEGNNEDVQAQVAAEEPGTISGYSYDFAEMSSHTPAANVAPTDAVGTPIYDSPIDEETITEMPLFDTESRSVMGGSVYDNATPLASPNHGERSFAKVTLKSLRESLVETLKQINSISTMKSLG